MPIPGTSSRERLEENIGAVRVRLTPKELARLNEIAPKGAAVGERYAPAAMELLNH